MDPRASIQSLQAVDAWIDVINANINGGVRTAFKSSRLKFAGSNVDVQRAGTSTSLPLQMPESSLTTANTIIDFTQGAVTASTEFTHIAIQGEGFFVLRRPTDAPDDLTAPVFLSRDGEFRWQAIPVRHALASGGYIDATNPVLVHSSGLVAVSYYSGVMDGNFAYEWVEDPNPGSFGGLPFGAGGVLNSNTYATDSFATDIQVATVRDMQALKYSQYGSTVFELTPQAGAAVALNGTSRTTVLTKSLEASNASMTQSVPELSLAQKLFSALTKVLQTHYTNTDAVLNLVR
jgi:flagellar hook protein FlgE